MIAGSRSKVRGAARDSSRSRDIACIETVVAGRTLPLRTRLQACALKAVKAIMFMGELTPALMQLTENQKLEAKIC